MQVLLGLTLKISFLFATKNRALDSNARFSIFQLFMTVFLRRFSDYLFPVDPPCFPFLEFLWFQAPAERLLGCRIGSFL